MEQGEIRRGHILGLTARKAHYWNTRMALLRQAGDVWRSAAATVSGRCLQNGRRPGPVDSCAWRYCPHFQPPVFRLSLCLTNQQACRWITPRVILWPRTVDIVGLLSIRHDAHLSFPAELEEGQCWLTPALWGSSTYSPDTGMSTTPVLPCRARLSPQTEALNKHPPPFCISYPSSLCTLPVTLPRINPF